VWAPARGNPWVSGLMASCVTTSRCPRQSRELPDPSRSTIRTISDAAGGGGFEQLDFHFWQGQQLVGGAGATAASAARFVLDAMSFGRLLAAQPPTVRATVEAEVRELFAAHQTPSGVVMGANAWLVSAYRA